MTINLLQPEVPGAKVTSVWQRSSRFITCVFCEMRGRQVGTSPLCSNCLIDPVQTRAAIHAQLDSWLAQIVIAEETWETIRDAHFDKWKQIEAARKLPGFAEKAARHRAQGNTYGKILDAEAAYERAVQALGAERARLERALEACDA